MSDVERRIERVRLLDTAGAFVGADGWYLRRLSDWSLNRSGSSGKDAQVICLRQIDPNYEPFILLVATPMQVLTERHQQIVKCITPVYDALDTDDFATDCRQRQGAAPWK